jgi:hypothetical protein
MEALSLFFDKKLNIGINSPLRVDREIGKPYALIFACNSFPSLG